MVKWSHAADLSSACQSILGSISGGIGIPAIAPFVEICIFHLGGCSGPEMRKSTGEP